MRAETIDWAKSVARMIESSAVAAAVGDRLAARASVEGSFLVPDILVDYRSEWAAHV